jgi:hypothetical protein
MVAAEPGLFPQPRYGDTPGHADTEAGDLASLKSTAQCPLIGAEHLGGLGGRGEKPVRGESGGLGALTAHDGVFSLHSPRSAFSARVQC